MLQRLPGLPFLEASMISAALSRAACALSDGIVWASIVFVLGANAKPESFHDEEPDMIGDMGDVLSLVLIDSSKIALTTF